MNLLSDNPIGFFDSGIGGLTVMKEVTRRLPYEHIVYFADTANLPYGDKSPSTVVRLALNNASFLQEKKIKLLVVACFTASALALEILEQNLSVPVIGVIRCGINGLDAVKDPKRIAILGTNATVSSGVIQERIRSKFSSVELWPLACPLFVPWIEEGHANHPATPIITDLYLGSLKNKNLDAALLACTHFPLIRNSIQNSLGQTTLLIEPAHACAIEVAENLKKKGLLRKSCKKPKYSFFTSDNPQKFHKLTSLFFGSEVLEVSEVKT